MPLSPPGSVQLHVIIAEHWEKQKKAVKASRMKQQEKFFPSRGAGKPWLLHEASKMGAWAR